MATPLPLFPELSGGPAPLPAHNTVAYAELPIRSLLTRCTSRRVPFEWTINPYRGCEFGCHYCYARYTHEFMELRGAYDFERQIFVKADAASRLRRELHKVSPGERIAIGSATDPYQPAERRYQITRSLLETLAEWRDLRIGIITKSDLVVRDRDVLARIATRNRLHVRLTITTMDVALARALEPRAPRPDLRLRAVAALAAAGLCVGVMCAPVLPAITDSRAGLTALAAAAKAAGAGFFDANALFLQPCAQARWFPFLDEQFPHLTARYRRAYAHSAYLPRTYTEALRRRVGSIRTGAGFTPPPGSPLERSPAATGPGLPA